MTSGLLDKADPARGRFRGFLKTALGNFAIEHVRREQASKRGGDLVKESIEAAELVVDDRARSPEQALDDAWRRELLERAHARLRDELYGNGRAVHWQLFHDFYLADGEQPTHQDLCERYEITRADVSNWLDHAKRRYRALLRDLVSETVTTPAELDDELQWLFGVVRRPVARGKL